MLLVGMFDYVYIYIYIYLFLVLFLFVFLASLLLIIGSWLFGSDYLLSMVDAKPFGRTDVKHNCY